MSEERGERRPRPRGGRRPRRKVCSFCVDKIEYIDYKDINRLRRFVNERGKILPRRMSGNCAKHQRQLSEANKFSGGGASIFGESKNKIVQASLWIRFRGVCCGMNRTDS